MKKLMERRRIQQEISKVSGLLDSPNLNGISGVYSDNEITAAYASLQGWRKTMEDAFSIELNYQTEEGEKIRIFCMFDGHGGDHVAQYCKLNYIPILTSLQSFKEKNYVNAFVETNITIDGLLNLSSASEQLKEIGSEACKPYLGLFGDQYANGIGTTACIVMILNDFIICSNVGDSRCILANKNSPIDVLSIDHKPHLESELNRITKAGGEIVNNRVNGSLNLTRTIGDLRFKNNPNLNPQEQIISCFPDVFVHKRNGDEDFIVLGCDGLWDMFNNENCVDKIYFLKSHGHDLKQIAEQLSIDSVTKNPRGSPAGYDNVTIIIIQFNS